jgi:alpha-L-rhamnosidase
MRNEAHARGVKFEGVALESNKQYEWSLQLIDLKGHLSSSVATTFTTGLNALADWTGAMAIGGCENQGNFLRHEFSLPAAVALESISRAVAYVGAPGTFKFSVNGHPASDNQLGAYTQFDRRVLFDSLDVTALLVKGCNALGFILGTGWYFLSFAALQQRPHS